MALYKSYVDQNFTSDKVHILVFCDRESIFSSLLPFSRVANFIVALYKSYVDLYFTYLEVNPLVITSSQIYILDLAAKVVKSPRNRRMKPNSIFKTFPARRDRRLYLPREVGKDRLPSSVRKGCLSRGGLHRRH